MKLNSCNREKWRSCRAFTLAEALIVSITLVFVIGSVIMANLYGLSMATRQQIWLGASDDAAQAMGKLLADIRSANTLFVGTYNSSVFAQVATTNQQSGNALQIYPTTNLYPCIVYYYDPTSSNMFRTNYNGPGVAGDYKLVSANPITNDLTHPIFTEVDYTGTPLSNSTTVACISIYLSFTELQNPQVKIESGSLVDLYQIITTVTPRIKL